MIVKLTPARCGTAVRVDFRACRYVRTSLGLHQQQRKIAVLQSKNKTTIRKSANPTTNYFDPECFFPRLYSYNEIPATAAVRVFEVHIQ